MCTRFLDDADLVGNVNGLVVGAETNESLLLAVGADEGVDLDGLDVVHLLDGVLDLVLVGVDVDDEDEGVVGLNLGHGGLSGQRVAEDGVLIQTGAAGDRSTGISRLARNGQRVRTTELDSVEDTTGTSREVTLQSSLLSGLRASSLRGRRGLLGHLNLLSSSRSLSLIGHLYLILGTTQQSHTPQGQKLLCKQNSHLHTSPHRNYHQIITITNAYAFFALAYNLITPLRPHQTKRETKYDRPTHSRSSLLQTTSNTRQMPSQFETGQYSPETMGIIRTSAENGLSTDTDDGCPKAEGQSAHRKKFQRPFFFLPSGHRVYVCASLVSATSLFSSAHHELTDITSLAIAPSIEGTTFCFQACAVATHTCFVQTRKRYNFDATLTLVPKPLVLSHRGLEIEATEGFLE